jgi:aminocarboxymuconate-semialdehyde decarboxylase
MEAGSSMEKRIDIHGHGVPPGLVAQAREHGARYGGVTVEGDAAAPVFTFPGAKTLRPVPAGMIDVEDRCAWLDAHGVAAQLVGPWLDVQGTGLAPEQGRAWASMVNDAMAEWCAASGGRLVPLASMHLADATAAAKELERAARELGCVGAMLPTHHAYGALTVDGWEPLWEVAEAEQLPIILHPPVAGPTMLEGQEKTLAFRSLWGRPMDTTVVAASLLLDGLFERYPRVRVVLVHGGAYLPYQAGRLDGEVANGRVASRLADGVVPSSHVGNFYFDTTLMSAAAIRLLVDSYGADHVAIGSDYPFFARIVGPCAELDQADIAAADRTVVGWDSALALFPRLQVAR